MALIFPEAQMNILKLLVLSEQKLKTHKSLLSCKCEIFTFKKQVAVNCGDFCIRKWQTIDFIPNLLHWKYIRKNTIHKSHINLLKDKFFPIFQVRLGTRTYQQCSSATVSQEQGGPAWQVAPGHSPPAEVSLWNTGRHTSDQTRKNIGPDK